MPSGMVKKLQPVKPAQIKQCPRIFSLNMVTDPDSTGNEDQALKAIDQAFSRYCKV